MYRSTAYAGEKHKSVFVDLSERSAETARLLRQAREARLEGLPKSRRTLAGWAASQFSLLLQRIGEKVTQRGSQARGQAPLSEPRPGC